MNELIQETAEKYHRPRFIPDLGEEGLSCGDIAEALGVSVYAVREKLRRLDRDAWAAMGWHVVESSIKTGKAGRPKVIWYLNTSAAKVFVARWDNEKGNGYLAFLLACEAVATGARPEALPPKKHLVDVPVGYVIQGSLFGDAVVIPRLAKIEKSKLTPTERRKAKSHHLTRVIEGATKAKRKIEDEEMIESLPPMARPDLTLMS